MCVSRHTQVTIAGLMDHHLLFLASWPFSVRVCRKLERDVYREEPCRFGGNIPNSPRLLVGKRTHLRWSATFWKISPFKHFFLRIALTCQAISLSFLFFFSANNSWLCTFFTNNRCLKSTYILYTYVLTWDTTMNSLERISLVCCLSAKSLSEKPIWTESLFDLTDTYASARYGPIQTLLEGSLVPWLRQKIFCFRIG